MTDQTQERRTSCPARRLEADGRVLTCAEDDPAKPMTHCNPEWHDSGMVVWHESDPMAWRDGDESLLDLAFAYMEPEDIVPWLHSPNEMMEGQRPLDDIDRATDLLHAVASGAYL